VITIKFIIQDDEHEVIAVQHDGIDVWEDSAPDAWTQYFRHFMPRNVPVLLTTDAAEREGREDPRPYPWGEGTDARLKRWLVDNGTDPRIRDEDGVAGEEITINSKDLHWLLLQAAERFYFYGVEDVRTVHGLR
jgi:hypothetical protein